MSPRRPEKPAPVIVKRPTDERKKLPPELEAFARSQDEKLRLRRPKRDTGRINDPREGYVIAGVSNRDARSVYDARAEAMRALWGGGQAEPKALAELGQLLHDALRLTLWRARRVVGFDAFVEQVVGLGAERAKALVDAHTSASGESPEPLNERTVALWLRTEAGLFEGDTQARVQLRSAKLVVSVDLSGASAAFAGAGARHAPLAREAAEAPVRREAPARARDSEQAPARVEVADDVDLELAADTPEPGSAAPIERPSAPPGARLLTRKRPADAEGFGAGAGPDAAAAREDKRERFGRKHEGKGAYPTTRDARPGDASGARGGRARPDFARADAGGAGGFGAKRPFRRDTTESAEGGAPFVKRGFGAKRPHGDFNRSDEPRGRGERGFAPRQARGEGAGFGRREDAGNRGGFAKRGDSDQRGGFKAGGFVKRGDSDKRGGFKAGGFVKRGDSDKRGGFKAGGFVKRGDSDKGGGFGKRGDSGKSGGFGKSAGFGKSGGFGKSAGKGARGAGRFDRGEKRGQGAGQGRADRRFGKQAKAPAARGKFAGKRPQRDPSDADD